MVYTKGKKEGPKKKGKLKDEDTESGKKVSAKAKTTKPKPPAKEKPVTKKAPAPKKKVEKKPAKILKTLKISKSNKTHFFSDGQVPKQWVVVDLKGQVVGRAAAAISRILRGKNKVTFTPHADTGDFVVAINADHLRFTGNKWQQKVYHRYSGYIGGLKTINADKLFEKNPCAVLENAVKGMLPKNPLGKKMIKKLKIYRGAEHPHQSQKAQIYSLQ